MYRTGTRRLVPVRTSGSGCRPRWERSDTPAMVDPELTELHHHLAQYPHETLAVVLARFPLFFARLLIDAVGGEAGPVTTPTIAAAYRQAVVESCSWIPVVPVNASQWLRTDLDDAAAYAFTAFSLDHIAAFSARRFLDALDLLGEESGGTVWVALGTGVLAGSLLELGADVAPLDYPMDLARAQAAIDAVKAEAPPTHPVMWLTFGDDPTPHYVLCPPEQAQGTFQLQPAAVAFYPGATTPWDTARTPDQP